MYSYAILSYSSWHCRLPMNVSLQPTKSFYMTTPQEHTIPIWWIVAIEQSWFMQWYQAYCWDVPSPPQIAYSSRSVQSWHRDASTSTQHYFEVCWIEIIQLLGWRAQLKVHLLPPTTNWASCWHYLDKPMILYFIRVWPKPFLVVG
jgi:hypothetical protein